MASSDGKLSDLTNETGPAHIWQLDCSFWVA